MPRPPIAILSVAEQIAAHLRGELERGQWTGEMPGANWLAREYGLHRQTVEEALQLLEKRGTLAGQGAGRKRRIVGVGSTGARPLRIAILDYDRIALTEGYTVELQHLLLEAGHAVFFTEKSLTELGMDVGCVARLVGKTKADAWVIGSGSQEVLEWFCAQPKPAFAFFGRREGLPIASVGPNKVPAIIAATRHLIGLGHGRIVMIGRRERRQSGPGPTEHAVLDELKAHGIPTGHFNLPDWEESPQGLRKLLLELFRVSPPTALIIDEAAPFAATQQFLARQRIVVPEQVSLVCTDADPTFAMCEPAISHIRWDHGPVIRRIVRWAAHVSRGHRDVRQTLTPANFFPGGTIGRAPRG